jgi:hypothetical protein
MRKHREREPEKLSEALRKQTEAKWPEDRFLSSAGGGPGCWCDDDDDG